MKDEQAKEESHPLALPYFKCHRAVLETFIEQDVGAPAQRLYLYLCHNSLVHHGVSHKLDIVEIAEYFKKTPRRVYTWIAELENAGLIQIRSHGQLVCALPYLKLGAASAKSHAIDAQQRREEKQFMKEVDAAIADMESTLGRSLTDRERRAFISRRSQRKYANK